MTDVLAISTNPAIDRIALADGAAGGGVVRAREFLETPGGKGAHVAMVARRLGAKVGYVAPVGGLPGARFEQLLVDELVSAGLVGVSSPTRGTYTVVDPDAADVVEVHEPSGALKDDDVTALVEAACRALVGARVAVVAGSLPPGTRPDLHARLVAAARRQGVICILDTSTPRALELGLRAGPDVATPNVAEAAELLGTRVDATAALPELARLARDVRSFGADAVLLTVGARGSILTDREGATWHTSAPRPVKTVNAVGCGDALVAGLAVALAQGTQLREAVALGAAAAADKLTHLHSGYVDLDRVRTLVGDVKIERMS